MATVVQLSSSSDATIEVLPKTMKIKKANIQNIRIREVTESTINNIFVENILKYDPITLNYEITSNFIMNSYILNNRIANACFYDVIINTYKKQIEESKKSDGVKRYKFELTYESLFRLCRPECATEEDIEKAMNNNMYLTFEKSIAFFEKFNLSLRVINPNNKIIYEYNSEKVNKKINPQTLELIFHNNHVYKITKNRSFEHKELEVINPLFKEITNNEEIISNKYRLSYKEEKNIILMKTNTCNEIFDYIRDSKENNFIFVCNEELKTITYELIDKKKFQPIVTINKGVIINIFLINLKVDKRIVNFMVKMPFCDIDHDQGSLIPDKEYYDLYFNEQQKMFLNYINKNNLSYYNEKTYKCLNMYYPTIQYGQLNEINNKDDVVFFDFTKAYTKMFMNLKNLPVINVAERFRLYYMMNIILLKIIYI